MKYSNEELLKLWSNGTKRRTFAEKYKEWGEFTSTPELNLTYYKYDLPDGSKLLVMEYMQENYYRKNEDKWRIGTKVYLQKGEFFMPHPVNDGELDDHLKGLKQRLIQEKEKSNEKE